MAYPDSVPDAGHPLVSIIGGGVALVAPAPCSMGPLLELSVYNLRLFDLAQLQRLRDAVNERIFDLERGR